MPTVHPHYRVTETPEVARALNLAAQRWPDEPRSKLLVRLLTAGRHALEVAAAEETRHGLAAVEATRGTYAEIFHQGYLAELRRVWPE